MATGLAVLICMSFFSWIILGKFGAMAEDLEGVKSSIQSVMRAIAKRDSDGSDVRTGATTDAGTGTTVESLTGATGQDGGLVDGRRGRNRGTRGAGGRTTSTPNPDPAETKSNPNGEKIPDPEVR